MKNGIQPYLHFNSNCKEAIEFYHQTFGGELYIQFVGESPAKDSFPEEVYDQVLHATLTHGSFTLMASDMCGYGVAQTGNAVELSLNCDSEDELVQLFEALKKKGEVRQAPEAQFWGALFAMVTDKFGIQWMLSFDNNPD